LWAGFVSHSDTYPAQNALDHDTRSTTTRLTNLTDVAPRATNVSHAPPAPARRFASMPEPQRIGRRWVAPAPPAPLPLADP
jgi:hypothetical protein